MKNQYLTFLKHKIVIFLVILGLFFTALLFFVYLKKAKAETVSQQTFHQEGKNLPLLEGNSLLPLSSPFNPPQVAKRIKMVITGYSSSPWETDDTPYLTASGAYVREGVVANNFLSFGTKIRIPEIFGDKIFIVEDRMNWKAGNYHLDVWFPSRQEALAFGSKISYIEILE